MSRNNTINQTLANLDRTRVLTFSERELPKKDESFYLKIDMEHEFMQQLNTGLTSANIVGMFGVPLAEE